MLLLLTTASVWTTTLVIGDGLVGTTLTADKNNNYFNPVAVLGRNIWGWGPHHLGGNNG